MCCASHRKPRKVTVSHPKSWFFFVGSLQNYPQRPCHFENPAFASRGEEALTAPCLGDGAGDEKGAGGSMKPPKMGRSLLFAFPKWKLPLLSLCFPILSVLPLCFICFSFVYPKMGTNSTSRNCTQEEPYFRPVKDIATAIPLGQATFATKAVWIAGNIELSPCCWINSAHVPTHAVMHLRATVLMSQELPRCFGGRSATMMSIEPGSFPLRPPAAWKSLGWSCDWPTK